MLSGGGVQWGIGNGQSGGGQIGHFQFDFGTPQLYNITGRAKQITDTQRNTNKRIKFRVTMMGFVVGEMDAEICNNIANPCVNSSKQ